MKRVILLLVAIFLSSLASFAEESAFDAIDTTNYSSTTQNLKYFSEKEYQQAIQDYKNKFQKPKKVKKKDIKTPTSTFSNVEENPEFQILEDIINHKGSIMIPTLCTTENGQEIYPGHYSLEYQSDDFGNQWLILSQGSAKIAKILSKKSKAAGDESTINYAYALGKGDKIKLLYGNIDVAVEADLYVENQ